MSQETTFDYNKEVVDLLFKNVIGTQYTSSELTPGQENLSLTTIQHEQIYSQPIPTSSKDKMEWSVPETLVGGGTVSYLNNVTGEGNTFTYIKKYENIMMEPTILYDDGNRAWIPINSLIRTKLKNMIKGKIAFQFIIETNIAGSTIINSNNGQFNPIVNNGILLFLGETYPAQNAFISFKELYIYEGKLGLDDITFPKSSGELSVTENVGKIYFNTDENKFLECIEDEVGNIEWQPLGSSFFKSDQFVGQPPPIQLINTPVLTSLKKSSKFSCFIVLSEITICKPSGLLPSFKLQKPNIELDVLQVRTHPYTL